MSPLIVRIVRVSLAAMFMFTGASHFSSLKHDMAAMIPPPFTGALWVIYATGILEIAGGLGLLLTRWRKRAAWGLVALLVAVLPANIYAALSGVAIGGHPPFALWWRVPLQLLWIGLLWWSSIRASNARRSRQP